MLETTSGFSSVFSSVCKMSGFQDLKDLFRRRLLAAVTSDLSGQTTTCGHEEELHRQRKLLDVILTPEIKLQRADVLQLVVIKEELPPEQHERSPSLDQEDTKPPKIKEEQEELWSSQEGEQLQRPEQADTTMLLFSPLDVKSEDDEEKPQSSQLRYRQTEQIETVADGEDSGGAGPEGHLPPETEVKTEDSSEPETDVGNDWKKGRERQSGLNSVENVEHKGPKTYKKSHSCSVCGKTFQYKRHMTDHIRIHTGEKPFRCSICSKRFNRNSNLTRHMAIHRGEKSSCCPDCGKCFKVIEYMNKHMRIHRRKKKSCCPDCGKSFKENGYVNEHMRIHTGEKPFSCSVCKQRFFWRNQLKRHKCVEGHTLAAPQNQTKNKSKTQTGADVGDCGGVKPATNSEPERHLQPENQVKAEDSSEQKMNVCNDWKEAREQILGLNSVENITNVILKTEKKSHCCSVCGKTFLYKRHMTDHIRIHTGEKPFKCSICSKRFNRNSNLTRHMAIHRGEKSSCCPDCGKCFKVIEYMNKHMRIHRRKKKSCCPDCGKSFKENGYVNEHMRIHTGEKPFSCSVCKQRFFWRNQLKRHKCVEGHASAAPQNQTEGKRNTQIGADVGDCGGVKPATNSEPERHLQPENQVKAEDSSEQKMNVCNDWKEAREQHLGLNSVENVTNVILNTEKKSYSCSVCGKSFQYKQHLKDHIRIHTGEKPFRCSVCSKSFNRKYNLTRHMTIHRGEKKSFTKGRNPSAVAFLAKDLTKQSI